MENDVKQSLFEQNLCVKSHTCFSLKIWVTSDWGKLEYVIHTYHEIRSNLVHRREKDLISPVLQN